MEGKVIREVRGRIPVTLKIAFEVACARFERSQSNALEEAISDWLIKHGQPTSIAPVKFQPGNSESMEEG